MVEKNQMVEFHDDFYTSYVAINPYITATVPNFKPNISDNVHTEIKSTE